MLLLSRTKCATALTSLAIISLNCNDGDGLAFGNRPSYHDHLAGDGRLQIDCEMHRPRPLH